MDALFNDIIRWIEKNDDNYVTTRDVDPLWDYKTDYNTLYEQLVKTKKAKHFIFPVKIIIMISFLLKLKI